jgi:hypothetical protein
MTSPLEAGAKVFESRAHVTASFDQLISRPC